MELMRVAARTTIDRGASVRCKMLYHPAEEGGPRSIASQWSGRGCHQESVEPVMMADTEIRRGDLITTMERENVGDRLTTVSRAGQITIVELLNGRAGERIGNASIACLSRALRRQMSEEFDKPFRFARAFKFHRTCVGQTPFATTVFGTGFGVEAGAVQRVGIGFDRESVAILCRANGWQPFERIHLCTRIMDERPKMDQRVSRQLAFDVLPQGQKRFSGT